MIRQSAACGAPANSSHEHHWCEEVMNFQNNRRFGVMVFVSYSNIPMKLLYKGLIVPHLSQFVSLLYICVVMSVPLTDTPYDGVHIGLSENFYNRLDTSAVEQLHNCTSRFFIPHELTELECQCQPGATGRYCYVYIHTRGQWVNMWVHVIQVPEYLEITRMYAISISWFEYSHQLWRWLG